MTRGQKGACTPKARRSKQFLVFALSMPGVASWNGKWSGAGWSYLAVRPAGTAGHLAGKSFGYSFGDGWFASIDVTLADAAGARRARKESVGFCGYEWMIDSILTRGRIAA